MTTEMSLLDLPVIDWSAGFIFLYICGRCMFLLSLLWAFIVNLCCGPLSSILQLAFVAFIAGVILSGFVEIGERVMAALRDADQVAYVRFASVYRKFQAVKDFIHEIKGLKK